jgi:hypothetical protein
MEQKKIFHISEEEKLEKALKRTHEERFLMLMKLMKIEKMLKMARVNLEAEKPFYDEEILNLINCFNKGKGNISISWRFCFLPTWNLPSGANHGAMVKRHER